MALGAHVWAIMPLVVGSLSANARPAFRRGLNELMSGVRRHVGTTTQRSNHCIDCQQSGNE
eukprot:3939172-Amphidinium_carterae.1